MGIEQKQNLSFYGNREILKNRKVAFLCSRHYPPEIVLKAYDWAIEQRNKGVCVISGFHSQIEKDVLHFLLKGTQPVIMVLARGMQKKWPEGIKKAIDDNRILIVSPFHENVNRISKKTAYIRNQTIIQMADEIVVAHAEKDGQTEKILPYEKKIKRLDR